MNIIILSPENCISGGPELAHQMCYTLNRLPNINAYMCYVTISTPFTLAVDTPSPAQYSIYNTTHITDISFTNDHRNIVVVPETLTRYMFMIPKAKKVLWWMSVDNYIKTSEEVNLEYLRDNTFFHLFQSYYSMDYVNRKMPGVKGMYLSDYINEAHGKFIYPAEYRENIALFNPAKGLNEIMPLIQKTSWIKWIPLVDLEVEQMILYMQSGKIYVDFGKHPGKDRIPREAAANGCCVITNKEGAAAFAEDVPIPEQFKFANPVESLDKIDSLMHNICDNFVTYQDMFADYRKFIKSEKSAFENDVIKFVEYLNSH